MSDEEDFIPVEELQEIAKTAPLLAPATVAAISVSTGVHPGLATDAEVTMMELLVAVATDEGDQFAIMPLVMDPELALEAGIRDTKVADDND